MAARGLGLRELCRRAELDPSFFSKVLAGKRNPPSDEDALRRLAEALGLLPVEVIVAAGRIPTDWNALRSDPVEAVIVMAASYSDEVAGLLRRDFPTGLKVAILRDHGLEIPGA